VPRSRGRPPKFGRPATLVAFTLPNDVLEELRQISPDVGRAIVALVERKRRRKRRERPDVAELVSVGGRRMLIVVDPLRIGPLPGVMTVPFPPDRAAMALSRGATLADLELAVVERLEEPNTQAAERESLVEFRRLLRSWRMDKTLRFEPRDLVVGERVRARSTPLPSTAAGGEF
jgi:hypothetical protein